MFFHVGFSTPGTCSYTCRPINKQIFPCQQLGFLVEEVWHPKGSPGLICLLAESCWYACLGLQTHLWHFQWKFGCSGMGRREQDLQELMTADVSWCVQCPMLNGFQDVSRCFKANFLMSKGFKAGSSWQEKGGKVLQQVCVCVQKMTGRPRDWRGVEEEADLQKSSSNSKSRFHFF